MGTRIYRASTEQFDTELGPVMANFVLADEVNRAPAKVQSALLEVMAEHQVSIAGVTYPVPEPFLVLATQNPIESEGVYPLPEAQRDRFLLKILLDYPTPAEEVEIVFRMGVEPPVPSQVLDPATIQRLQRTAAHTYCDRAVVDYAVSLVMASRNPSAYALGDIDPYITFGASPRASLGLVAAGRALALMRGRSYTTPQDVYDVAPDVLRHRLVLSYEALAQGLEADQVLTRILSTVPAPRVAPEQDGQLAARTSVPASPSLPPPPGNGGTPAGTLSPPATTPTQPVNTTTATPAPWSDRTPNPAPEAPSAGWPRPSTTPTAPDSTGPAAPE
jgi:MoxR-like ATPase